jgi:tRNA A37 threonylcarbamoyladenosine synthetase subunit TsaC/SUA5/YrdC
VEEAEKYVQAIPAPLLRLMQTFSPGPLTVLLKKKMLFQILLHPD